MRITTEIPGDLSRQIDRIIRDGWFADQEAKMAEIEERYSDGEITHLDGVTVDYPDWHFNVRPSNTEPLLRLNLESLVSREDMEHKRDEVLGLIRE